MRSKFSIIATIALIGINLNAYDKELESFISSTIDQKMVEYKLLKEENLKQKVQLQEFEYRVDELEETIESVETRTLVDKVNFGLGFTTSVNSYDKKYADSSTHKSNNLYTTKLMLNMNAKITDKMKFTGKLSMYKYWADSTIHMYSRFDNMQGRVPSTSALYVERAFVDWKIADNDSKLPSVLTIGRQPSSDGPSHQYKTNTTRKATYSALVFDGASDGIVLTSSLKNISPLKNSRIRIAYGKGFQNDQTKQNVTNAFIGSDDSLKDTDVYGLFFESSILGYSNTLFQIGVANMDNIVSNPLDSNDGSNKNIGDATFIGIMFEGTNIKNSGVDLFAHISHSHVDPSDVVYTVNSTNYSFLSDGSDFSEKSATAFWLGGRYTFDNKTKLGLEYNQGSRYWVSASQGASDLLNKLSTRGKAYEAYYIYPINRYSYLKFGGINIDYDYTNSGWFLGEPKKFNSLNSNESANYMSSIKNFYLQFGLNY
jgi:hypothetical protein